MIDSAISQSARSDPQPPVQPVLLCPPANKAMPVQTGRPGECRDRRIPSGPAENSTDLMAEVNRPLKASD
jgi:hypothetical protein